MTEITKVPESAADARAVSSAVAVAFDIRRRVPEADRALVHKLLYFVQGEHLVFERRPAFEEEFEAWPQGPVVASLWQSEISGRLSHSSRPLPESVHNIVTNIVCRQRSHGCTEFMDDIAEPDPWQQATDGGRDVACQRISKQSLIDFFRIESPSLVRVRAAVAAESDGRAFMPSPPGALDALIERYFPGESL